MTSGEAREGFKRCLATPEPELDLAEGALWIAAEAYPELRPAAYLDRLDRMAAELKGRIGTETDPARVVAICNQYLFEELGFRGNREEYYDPRNSFLNDVMDRRLGIPITLSVVFVAIGERVGLPVRGVGMPGHFLVKYEPARGRSEILIDPFSGRVITREECAAMLKEMYGSETELRPSFFKASAKRQILARILNNLKGIYLSRGDLLQALAASDRIVLADPQLTAEWRDRGLIEFQLRRDSSALNDFTRYLGIRPEPEDAARIRQLRFELLGRLN